MYGSSARQFICKYVNNENWKCSNLSQTLWDWSCSIKFKASSLEMTSTLLTLFLCFTPYILSATFTSSGRNVVVMNCVFAMSAKRRIISTSKKVKEFLPAEILKEQITQSNTNDARSTNACFLASQWPKSTSEVLLSSSFQLGHWHIQKAPYQWFPPLYQCPSLGRWWGNL